jgi:hypothetical protein
VDHYFDRKFDCSALTDARDASNTSAPAKKNIARPTTFGREI